MFEIPADAAQEMNTALGLPPESPIHYRQEQGHIVQEVRGGQHDGDYVVWLVTAAGEVGVPIPRRMMEDVEADVWGWTLDRLREYAQQQHKKAS